MKIRKQAKDLSVSNDGHHPASHPNASNATNFLAPTEAETATLASEVGKAYRSVMEDFQRLYNKDEAESMEIVAKIPDERWVQRILKASPDQVSWRKLADLAHKDPELMQRKWSELKGIALAELQNGHGTAMAVETPNSEPMDRARFLALRHELREEWQPHNGIEATLIDQMAQFQWQYLHWMKIFTLYSRCDSERPSSNEAKWQPPQVSDAQAIEIAAAMTERFNRLFLRTLRALRDLRRHPVIVQNASQVNVGNQQINVSPSELSSSKENG